MTSEPARSRVLYALGQYPAISQTYVKAEIEAVRDDVDVHVVTTKTHPVSYDDHLPFEILTSIEETCATVEEVKPDVLHTHWLTQADRVAEIARRTGVPFTIRSHSFDTLWGGWRGAMYNRSPIGAKPLLPPHLTHIAEVANDELCLGILCFPFVRARLEKAGIPSHKLHDSWPVVDYEQFLDREPNGDRVMNTGAALGKKKMESYLDLAARMPEREFDIYPLGFKTDELNAQAKVSNSRVVFVPPVEPKAMPSEFKRHEWLVYFGNPRVGWPVSIAEAQAAGVGVCMQNVRPDIAEYVGPAGFLFDNLSEVERIISKPYPDEMREAGFEHAKKSDIRQHKSNLLALWP